MIYLNIPADFKKSTIDQYVALNEIYSNGKVLSTYGNISVGNFLASGRTVNALTKVNLQGLKDYVHYSRERKIQFEYTLNASHMSNMEFTTQGLEKISEFLYALREAGVHTLIVTLPSLIEIIKGLDLGFALKASVICQITNPNKARFYKELGVDKIVIDESLNRDFDMIKRMLVVFGEKVELILNSICFRDCTYRMFHYNQIASDSVSEYTEASVNYYSHRCLLKRYESLGNFFRLSWVRPEDLPYYETAGLQYYKLQGRHLVEKGDPVRAVKAYFERHYEGDLVALLNLFCKMSEFDLPIDNKRLNDFLTPFVKSSTFCRHECLTCAYCSKYATGVIDAAEYQQKATLYKQFLEEFDSFKINLRKAKNSKLAAASEAESSVSQDITFNFD